MSVVYLYEVATWKMESNFLAAILILILFIWAKVGYNLQLFMIIYFSKCMSKIKSLATWYAKSEVLS